MKEIGIDRMERIGRRNLRAKDFDTAAISDLGFRIRSSFEDVARFKVKICLLWNLNIQHLSTYRA